jgi:hypothetical protein
MANLRKTLRKYVESYQFVNRYVDKIRCGIVPVVLVCGLALDQALAVAYPANQISTTSGGFPGIRPDRTRPGGSIARMPASVSASSRYGDAVDVASRAA